MQEKTQKQEKKRLQALYELYTSEKDYLHDLVLWSRTFRHLVVNTSSLSLYTKQAFLSTVFINVEGILKLHEGIYGDMLSILGLSPDYSPDNFLGMSVSSRKLVAVCNAYTKRKDDILKEYTAYANRVPKASSEMETILEENKGFDVELVNVLKRVDRLEFGCTHFIFRPMQKITRYPLLLQAIKKRSRENEEEAIDNALICFREIDSKVNQNVQYSANYFALYHLGRSLFFEGRRYPSLSFGINQRERVLVREEEVVLLARGERKAVSIVLLDNCLFFTEISKSQTLRSLQKRRIYDDQVFPLCNIVIEKQKNEEKGGTGTITIWLYNTAYAFECQEILRDGIYQDVIRCISRVNERFVRTTLVPLEIPSPGTKKHIVVVHEAPKDIPHSETGQKTGNNGGNNSKGTTEGDTNEGTGGKEKDKDNDKRGEKKDEGDSSVQESTKRKNSITDAQNTSSESNGSDSFRGLPLSTRARIPDSSSLPPFYPPNSSLPSDSDRKCSIDVLGSLCISDTSGIYLSLPQAPLQKIHGQYVTGLTYSRALNTFLFFQNNRAYTIINAFPGSGKPLAPIRLTGKIIVGFFGKSDATEQEKKTSYVVAKQVGYLGSEELFIYKLLLSDDGRSLNTDLYRRMYMAGDIQSISFYGNHLALASTDFELIDLKDLTTQELLDPLDVTIGIYLNNSISKPMFSSKVDKNLYFVAFDDLGFFINRFGSRKKSRVLFLWLMRVVDVQIFKRYVVALGNRTVKLYTLSDGILRGCINIPAPKFLRHSEHLLVYNDSAIYRIELENEDNMP